MKKIILTGFAFLIAIITYSQTISKITIKGDGDLDVIAIGLDENVQVYLTATGDISKWGFDRFIGYQENYNNELVPYVGKIEYYRENDDPSVRGKIKYIGLTMLTWYPSYENDALKGKLKSIGSFNIDYYLPFEDAGSRGKIKSLGQNKISWYASYENKDITGKLKSVGPTTLTYYGSFEDKAFRGKVKSIGRFNLIYFSSFELYSGSLKSGSQIMNVNGVKYYARNF